jgi:ABC-type sugar transport system ATPase subunit
MALADRLVVLKEGVVQQVGRPLAVYRRPCNRFVAGFLGWPPMSLVHGQLSRTTEGGLEFSAPGGCLPLPLTVRIGWNGHGGGAVTLGIRPEDVHCGRTLAASAKERDRPQLGASLVMEVTVIEPLGSACLVTFQRGAWRVVGHVAGEPGLACGQHVEIGFNMDRLHLFDARSGLTLRDESRPDG